MAVSRLSIGKFLELVSRGGFRLFFVNTQFACGVFGTLISVERPCRAWALFFFFVQLFREKWLCFDFVRSRNDIIDVHWCTRSIKL